MLKTLTAALARPLRRLFGDRRFSWRLVSELPDDLEAAIVYIVESANTAGSLRSAVRVAAVTSYRLACIETAGPAGPPQSITADWCR